MGSLERGVGQWWGQEIGCGGSGVLGKPVKPEAHGHILPMPHPIPGPGKHRRRVPQRLQSAFCLLGTCLSVYKFTLSSRTIRKEVLLLLRKGHSKLMGAVCCALWPISSALQSCVECRDYPHFADQETDTALSGWSLTAPDNPMGFHGRFLPQIRRET